MATLISAATGNFTTAATWAVVDSTSLLDSEAGSTASTTSYVYSSTFTPGAITIDGVAIKVASRTASPTGTVTVELNNHTDSVSVTSVVINASDLANVQANQGWYFFKFAANQTLLAGKAYKIGFRTSVAATVTIYRDATAGNWSRMLRTTTTAAPAANDIMHTIGEWTGAGALTSFTVTMDNTATTSYGSTTPPQSFTVGNGGTISCGTSASTAYYLKYKGVMAVFAGGTLNLGTSGTPIPASSTCTLEMASAANVDTGLVIYNGAAVNIYGDDARGAGQTMLTADAAAAATVLTVASTSGWAAGDQIVIASTTRTNTQTEIRTILTVDSATQVTVTAGLTNAHSGTSPAQAEVMNLTRNVKIKGASTSLQGYIANTATTATVNIDSAEILQMGSATSNKRGLDIANTTGSFSITNCSLHDFIVTSSLGINITGATTNNITVQNCNFYNINNSHFTIAATSGTSWTVDGCMFMVNVAVVGAVILNDLGGTFTNNTLAGCAGTYCLWFGEASDATGTFSNIVTHSNLYPAIISGVTRGLTINNLTSWRNATNGGFYINSDNFNTGLNSPVFFGNATAGIYTTVPANNTGFTINNGAFSGDSTFSTPYGIHLSATGASMTGNINNTTFGVASGIRTAHTTADIAGIAGTYFNLPMNNTSLASTTEVASQSLLISGSYIGSERHDQTAGNHRSWYPTGNLAIDTTIYNAASPSARLTPNNASRKLDGVQFQVAVSNGQTLTPSVTVRKSVVGDGTAYNGSEPRLIVKRNDALGITSDTVLDTASGAAGSWETLTGTTATVTDDGVLTFIVDCDGTTGWVNVDDWDCSTTNNTKGVKYWMNGLPTAYGDNSAGGGGGSAANYYMAVL